MLLFWAGKHRWWNTLSCTVPPAWLLESPSYCGTQTAHISTHRPLTDNKTSNITTYTLNIYSSQFWFPLYCFFYVACSTNTPLPLPSISMVAERTCRSIWLIIFTLPAEAGLSWGYLHLSSSLLLCSVWQQLLLSIQSPFPLSLYVPKWPRTYWTYTASMRSWLIFCLPLYPISRRTVRNNEKATPFKTNNQSVQASRAVWLLLCFLMRGWTWKFMKKFDFCDKWQLNDWLV